MTEQNAPLTNLRNWNRGDIISADRLQEPIKALNEFFAGVEPSRQINTRGISRIFVQQFKVKSVAGDYITVQPWDGLLVQEANIRVAKPYLLRRTPFDGKTRDGITWTYTSDSARTGSDGTEQTLSENWLEDDIIYAELNITGGTDLAADGKAILWLDQNTDGRHWSSGDSGLWAKWDS